MCTSQTKRKKKRNETVTTQYRILKIYLMKENFTPAAFQKSSERTFIMRHISYILVIHFFFTFLGNNTVRFT